MKVTTVKKYFIIFICQFFLLCIFKIADAQKIEYSSENVFTNYPDHLQLVSNIAGNHHLVSFTYTEEPEIFIFNNELVYLGKIKIPFKFPERSEIRIIPFDRFYFLYTHSPLGAKDMLWKIDGNGNFTDLSLELQTLLRSQSHNIKMGFQLISNQKKLCLVYHTNLTDLEKNTLIIVQTDSLLNIESTNKVVYDFKREQERMQQEIIILGRYLLVLKTAAGNTSLQLMKINIATGYTVTNTFYSSGYLYSQPDFNYNIDDSAITVSSLLIEPRLSGTRRYIFLSRLNNMLVQQVPLVILKSGFLKNESTNFLLVDKLSKWIRLIAIRDRSMGDAIRFSLLDKNFVVTSDSLVQNNKNSYTLRPDQFARFKTNNKDYMLVSQRFFNRSNGLLMITADAGGLIYKDVRVNDRNDYMLSHAEIIPQGIIIPYTHKREAGLIKITAE